MTGINLYCYFLFLRFSLMLVILSQLTGHSNSQISRGDLPHLLLLIPVNPVIMTLFLTLIEIAHFSRVACYILWQHCLPGEVECVAHGNKTQSLYLSQWSKCSHDNVHLLPSHVRMRHLGPRGHHVKEEW